MGQSLILDKVREPRLNFILFESFWPETKIYFQFLGAGLKSKLNNCGDIVVGDSGHVVFQSTLNHSTRTTCTWTIRVNTSEKISVKIISDTLDPSVSTLLLVPMVEISRRNISVRTLLRAQKTM